MKTPHELIYIKFLYERGSELAREKKSFQSGMAISLYHDAIEMLIWFLSREFEAPHTKAQDIISKWHKVSEAAKKPAEAELPYINKFKQLNAARVNFKHHANLPDPDAGIQFGNDTYDILSLSYKRFFNIDFESILLLDFIENEDIRNHLKKAIKLKDESNFEDAAGE